jgi:hypothetical protein
MTRCASNALTIGVILKMTFDHPDGETSRARDDIIHSSAPINSFMLKRPKPNSGGYMAAKGRIEIEA